MRRDSGKNPLIVALDGVDKERALSTCSMLSGKVNIFKVGLQLYVNAGKEIVESIRALGCGVFLDLKLCDIPYQTGIVTKEIAMMQAAMFTIHTMGGVEMMKKAVEVVQEMVMEQPAQKPLVLGVTVLTSWNQRHLRRVGISRGLEDQVVELARLAKEAGLDGVVTSPREIKQIRSKLGDDFLIVTPGIRPVGSATQDQERTCTPKEAIDAGADYLVIGRPIMSASDPLSVVSSILGEIKQNDR